MKLATRPDIYSSFSKPKRNWARLVAGVIIGMAIFAGTVAVTSTVINTKNANTEVLPVAAVVKDVRIECPECKRPQMTLTLEYNNIVDEAEVDLVENMPQVGEPFNAYLIRDTRKAEPNWHFEDFDPTSGRINNGLLFMFSFMGLAVGVIVGIMIAKEE